MSWALHLWVPSGVDSRGVSALLVSSLGGPDPDSIPLVLPLLSMFEDCDLRADAGAHPDVVGGVPEDGGAIADCTRDRRSG